MKNIVVLAAVLALGLAAAAPSFAHGPKHRAPATATTKSPADTPAAVDASDPSAAHHHAHSDTPSGTEQDSPPVEHAGHGSGEAPDHSGHMAPVDDGVAGAEQGEHHHASMHEDEMVMQHPGLPRIWIWFAVVAMAIVVFLNLLPRRTGDAPVRSVNLVDVPAIGGFVRFLNATPYPLVAAKLITVAVFIVVIAAGLFGTAYPERNLATVLVWNLWWPLVVVSVFFLGSAWCAVCPWDALASWLVRHRLWKRVNPHPGLNRKVPTALHGVWVALFLFIALAWLELGADVTAWPMATALLGLVLLGLSVAFLLVFERKAFCRYACPVGRTLGFYSRLAPVALRPKDQATCDRCATLECFAGSGTIEPCPSHLTMGGLKQNTYCLSCGNCVLSCPHENVSWRLRPMGTETKERARPAWDEAWFMLALLGITSFHGFTMMPFWDDWIDLIGRVIGDTEHMLLSFTLSMVAGLVLPVLIYAAAIWLARLSARNKESYRQLFAGFAFTALPLAFAYHLAHNLSHLSGETGNLLAVLLNPFGIGLQPLTAAEQHAQMMSPLLPPQLLFASQAGLLVLGFWLAARIARNRAYDLFGEGVTAWRQLPLLGFICAITAINLWLMANDMVMRF